LAKYFTACITYQLTLVIENADKVRFIKSKRIAWLGHMMQMDENRTPKTVLEWKPIGRRIRGRPGKRWIEDVEEDGNKRVEKFM
jgi:hypothetical protein